MMFIRITKELKFYRIIIGDLGEKDIMIKRNEYYCHFFYCVVICGLIWNNDGYLWFQEELQEEYSNNRGMQVERLQQVGTRYLYLL